MLNFTRTLMVAMLCFLGSNVFAQDLHYTQYNMDPIHLNPALTGNFEGTFRIGAIYREQWGAVITNDRFRTPSFFIDAPLFRGIGKNDWIGVGAAFLNDQAGSVSRNMSTIMGGLTYNIGFGQKGNTVLSLGGQAGYIQERWDLSEASFGDQLTSGATFSNDLNNINDANIGYVDFNAGITLASKLNDRTDFRIGGALMHIGQPLYTKFTAAGQTNVPTDQLDLARRLVAHGEFNADLTKKWTLSPTFLYTAIEGADEIVVQTMAGYHFNDAQDVTFRFGAGYRLGDAAQALLGFDYKGLRVGAAYDFTTSDLQSSSSRPDVGGFEIGAWYVAKIVKAPTVKPIIFCPRF